MIYLKNHCERNLLGAANGLLVALDEAATMAIGTSQLQKIQGMQELAGALRDGVVALPGEIAESEDYAEAHKDMFGVDPVTGIEVEQDGGIKVPDYVPTDMKAPVSTGTSLMAPFMRDGKMVAGGTR